MTDRIDTAQEREKLAKVRKYKLVHGEPEYRSQMLVRPDGVWVPVSIYRSTAHRLLDALDAERARAEKAEAERDQYLAQLAAPLNCDDGVLYQAMNDGYGRYKDFKRDVLAAFRPAPNAEAALQRVVDETWNDAVEAAARVQDIAHQEGANAAGQHYAILALKRPEASHE